MLHLVLFLVPLLAPADAGSAIEGLLASAYLRDARVAVSVVDVDTSTALFARGIDQPMAPASNLKLLTTAAAIGTLGPQAVLTTRVASAVEPDATGVLAGDLLVIGSGDPSLRADALAPEGIDDPAALLAELVARAGVRRVDGALVLDGSALPDGPVHPDWLPGDLHYDFAAPVGALSIHRNCLAIEFDARGPGARLLTVADGYTTSAERLVRAPQPDTFDVGYARPDERGQVRVWGRMSADVGARVRLVPVQDPAQLFGACLIARLRERGIAVRDGARVAPGAADAQAGLVDLVELSSPISRAVLLANKESDNSMADHLLKVVGRHAVGEGTFDGGSRGLLAFLEGQVGTPTAGLVLRDGSGLSDKNRVTARAMTDTLVYMANAPGPARALFLRSLAVGGVDGSLDDRLTDPATLGRVRAKSGFISGVSGLSGYAYAHDGRVLAFSILFNGIAPGTNRHLKRLQDDVCRALVGRP